MQFVPFIFIFLVMYALIIRPQQKKAKEHDALLKQLKAGDKVATSSGIVGVITNIKENSVSLRSADSKLEILLPAIDRVLKEKDSGES
ncbi:MAG: preprotein translocase subunit YajC [Verrucomicrobia bacterium]|jgi:preprotein translocase subunit YajC|nr:preprotein translocase subunit YajC [Verrucomicrobiota bacterium]